jgi:AcrR family transcriptional regulator
LDQLLQFVHASPATNTARANMCHVEAHREQAPPSRVKRRQQLTRTRLTDAASKLIADRGVEGLRLREIIDTADVGFASFYTHFDSKEQLVEAVVIELMGSLADRLITHVQGMDDAAEAASAAHRWFVRNASDDPQTAWLVVHLDRADVLFQQAVLPYARPLLERGAEAGRFKAMDVDATLTYVVGATLAVTRGVLEGRLGPDADVRSAEALLGALGLDPDEAAEVARRDLPSLDGDPDD